MAFPITLGDPQVVLGCTLTQCNTTQTNLSKMEGSISEDFAKSLREALSNDNQRLFYLTESTWLGPENKIVVIYNTDVGNPPVSTHKVTYSEKEKETSSYLGPVQQQVKSVFQRISNMFS